MLWNANVYRGAEVKEFTYENLTPVQRQFVDMGLAIIEDYRPKGGFLGGNIDELKLFKPELSGDYKDGILDTEMTEEEFIKLLAVYTEFKKDSNPKGNTKKETTKKETPSPVQDEELKAKMSKLFG